VILEIKKWPDPILRQKTQTVLVFDSSLEELSKNMIDTMRAESAIGLAANQIGDERKIAVVQVPYVAGDKLETYHGETIVLVNPKIVESEGSVLSPEGCVSLLEVQDTVRRFKTVKVKYQTLTGEFQEIVASGLMARCLQHEIDHLNGKTLIEKASRIRKDMMIRRLRKTGNL
jgi:peptide deformylase